jgi:hypothetical protein
MPGFSSYPWSDLAGAIEALVANAKDVRLEVLVPESCGEAVRERIRDRFPDARIFPVSVA